MFTDQELADLEERARKQWKIHYWEIEKLIAMAVQLNMRNADQGGKLAPGGVTDHPQDCGTRTPLCYMCGAGKACTKAGCPNAAGTP